MDLQPLAEPLIRLACFGGVLLVMALWEIAAPRRPWSVSKRERWLSNLGLVAINTLVLRVLFPLGAVGVALVAAEHGWGIFHQLALPFWLSVALGVILLDLVIYLQHVLFHALPSLWRLHRVHHADLDFDVTTGIRFHTLEILLSFGIKVAAVIAIGLPALSVLVFEILLNATSMFNHGNVRLPRWLDRVLRLFVVTPEMHRVHHSVHVAETNSNFGFNLPWWDFLFGTYRAQPAAGHERMTIGLAEFRDQQVERLPWMLVSPFSSGGDAYPISSVKNTDSVRSAGR